MTTDTAIRNRGAGRSGRRGRPTAIVRDRSIAIPLLLPLILAAILVVTAITGFAMTRYAADLRTAAQRQAVQRAVEDAGIPTESGRTEPQLVQKQLALIVLRAGIAELRFDLLPPAGHGWEAQVLPDVRGRIIGWLSWPADRLIEQTDPVWGVLAVVGMLLALCGAVVLREGRRLQWSIGRGDEAVPPPPSRELLINPATVSPAGFPDQGAVNAPAATGGDGGTIRVARDNNAASDAATADDRQSLLHDLETAIWSQAFEVHYQPIVAAEGGALVGVEALLRWTHPRRGTIPPSVFIPLAEQDGLMPQLGEFVLRRALTQGAPWRDLFIAVNVSPAQIHDQHLVDVVSGIMAEAGIAASRVVLEVTEGMLIENPDEAQLRLQSLRALGLSIALDDFGTGYSSLGYLQKFAFDKLKIDRAFVASLGKTGNSGTIIQSIVTLGHALGMSVLAEGVETDEQRVLLRLAGCDEMQGYLFARPVPAPAIADMLASQFPAPIAAPFAVVRAS